MDEEEVAKRLIALVEDRVKVAESLGLSESGLMADVLTKVLAGDLDEVPGLLYELDERIQTARKAQ